MSASSQDIFLGRQPILDRNQQIVAYELLFRASSQAATADVTDDLAASARVIVQAFGELGMENVLSQKLGFINVSADLLMSELVELLPRERVVLELLETITITPEVVARCRELKAKGFHLALDDFVFDAVYEPLFELVEVVKIDLLVLKPGELEQYVKRLRNWPVKLLAEKIDSQAQADQCKELGFDFFQGYFFAKPVILSGRRADPSRLSLLRLIHLVLEDAETEELEKIFKADPGLTYSLLRLVNSVGMGLTTKITSLSHAIVVLGRRQLQRWLQLLLFAQRGGGHGLEDPLLQLAATRGKLMELLSGRAFPGQREVEDKAFMVGIMSLLDTLLSTPLEEILSELHLPDDVKQALLLRNGPLGRMLATCVGVERNDFDGVVPLLAELPGLTLGTLARDQVAALAWASAIGHEA